MIVLSSFLLISKCVQTSFSITKGLLDYGSHMSPLIVSGISLYAAAPLMDQKRIKVPGVIMRRATYSVTGKLPVEVWAEYGVRKLMASLLRATML